MARSPSRSRRERSRSKRAKRGSRSRDRSRSKRKAKDKQRSRSHDRSRSKARRAKRSRSASRGARRRSVSKRRSRSRSRRVRRRSGTPERVPPTNFADYEPSPDGSGWYKYKKMGKWSYHPETGLYLHIKSGVHYVQKDGDPRSFRKIEDEDDRIIRKMKQSEEMRKAIQNTEFVTFGGGDGSSLAAASTDDAPRASGVPFAPDFVEVKTAPVPEPKAEEVPAGDQKHEGKVREWNSEKGFGFIVPLGKEGPGSVLLRDAAITGFLLLSLGVGRLSVYPPSHVP